jgi:hypothetical protein
MLPALILLAQLAATPPADVSPVLAFPEAGLDDTAAYAGYRTRFFRDAAGNTVQLYVDPRAGRMVHLWADAENASAGFTARDGRGRVAALRWGGPGATAARDGRARTLAHRLVADGPTVSLGWFVLASMRVERDLQYAGAQRKAFGPRFALPEIDRMLARMEALPPAERARHLAALGAPDVRTLRARVAPRITLTRGPGQVVARVVQPSLDARDTMAIDFTVDPARVAASVAGDSLVFRARGAGREVPFAVRVSTTGATLTPLAREEIFTPEFLAFLAAARAAGGGADSAGVRARLLERQVRGVELISSREKLMAGLPTYATYFGRDQLVTALMMRPVWRGAMSEAVIASVLRKLSPAGEVSHEEALGGQAVREGAAEYAALVDSSRAAAGRGDRAAGDSLLARAREVVGTLRRVRENYHMVDDEFQLPVLVARWLADSGVTAAGKRAFLLDSADGGGSRLVRLTRELALVARLTAPYVADPRPANLIPFAPRDATGWASASWRDSGAGYAGGRYAMDVNAVWVPHALASIGSTVAALRALGLDLDAAVLRGASGAALAGYLRDPASLIAAVARWRGAERHFVVRLAPAEVRERVAARVAALPAADRAYWSARTARGEARDSLAFLAVALDGAGAPIGVANSDPATRLFLGEPAGAPGGSDEAAAVLRDVRLFVRSYPEGLLVDRVGPVVANDAYAPPSVWAAFARDPYHGPRVVWGREVNLFLLGAVGRLAGSDARAAAELRDAVRRVRAAAGASGFQSELWSYEVARARVAAARYGTGADVQLWSTTDLAVEFTLARLGL